MYRLDPTPEFWATVTVRRPGEGGHSDRFRARFMALTISAFEGYDLSSPEATREFLTEVLKEIDEVEAEDGSALRLTSAVRDRMLDAPHIRAALVRAYLESFSEALLGN
jgi:hypothetical protein